MVGIYFSGTGNSKYCVERFLQKYDAKAQTISIEDKDAGLEIQKHKKIVIGYPVQFSNVPKILRDFVVHNHSIWEDKEVFVIATMGLFSGDGSGVLARLLQKYGATIIGGLHLKMPDSICDEKVLKRSLNNNKKLIVIAKMKIEIAVQDLKNGNPPQEGLGLFYHLAGLFGQRLYFYNKTKKYSNKLKIDITKCVSCGKCINVCPMKNIHLNKKKVVAGNQCTMCYRCISKCPMQAITLLGKRVIEQCYIEKYL